MICSSISLRAMSSVENPPTANEGGQDLANPYPPPMATTEDAVPEVSVKNTTLPPPPIQVPAPTAASSSPATETKTNTQEQVPAYTAPPQVMQPGIAPVPLTALQDAPMPVLCPNCHRVGYTVIEYHTGTFANLSALVMCCCCCLGCIPYMMTWFKDAVHKCSSCGVNLARYTRSDGTILCTLPVAAPAMVPPPAAQPQPS